MLHSLFWSRSVNIESSAYANALSDSICFQGGGPFRSRLNKMRFAGGSTSRLLSAPLSRELSLPNHHETASHHSHENPAPTLRRNNSAPAMVSVSFADARSRLDASDDTGNEAETMPESLGKVDADSILPRPMTRRLLASASFGVYLNKVLTKGRPRSSGCVSGKNHLVFLGRCKH